MTEQRWPAPVLPLHGPARAAGTLIVLSAVAGVAVTVADWHTSSVADEYIADTAELTIDDLRDAEALAALASWGYLGITLLAALAFILWCWRARLNAEALSPARHRLTRGWVIGGWFCPVVQLWFPYQVVSDIEKASRPDATADLRANPLIGRWWVMLVVSLLLDQYVTQVVLRTVSAETLREAAGLTTVASGLQLIAAVMALVILRRITAAQAA
ncbi:DUF4328 domain-containing protein [Amycolatopsis albispora]|uniref:DUF4328 domain-containing protein n=1 Tax=Amycolatopsis albispora TaxID=1804986 RepID=A0A344LD07_9PSEU|nr:DUF4328 domain-containing protein [Amycolatopsis albispora]AXB45931.1 hypothetical protein A4R43_28475 [Amycolatopsis albispora]